MTQTAEQTLLTIPDSVLGTQMFALPDWTPEQKLMHAILEEAIDCLKPGRSIAGNTPWDRLIDETESWIKRDDWVWPFSFVNICQALDLDQDYIRRGITTKFVQGWQKKRLGPNGEILPRGIHINRQCKTNPYRVFTYRKGKDRYHAFSTLSEASAFYEQYQARKKRPPLNWARQRLLKARVITHICTFCSQQILPGDLYRRAAQKQYTKYAHEVCTQQQVTPPNEGGTQ